MDYIMDNDFMELGEALTTVWELANQNNKILLWEYTRIGSVLSRIHSDELQHSIIRQKLALDTVEDFITNKFGEE